jgi:hypothetical protein
MEEAGYEDLLSRIAGRSAGTKTEISSPDPARFPSGIKALADYVHSVVMVKITP